MKRRRSRRLTQIYLKIPLEVESIILRVSPNMQIIHHRFRSKNVEPSGRSASVACNYRRVVLRPLALSLVNRSIDVQRGFLASISLARSVRRFESGTILTRREDRRIIRHASRSMPILHEYYRLLMINWPMLNSCLRARSFAHTLVLLREREVETGRITLRTESLESLLWIPLTICLSFFLRDPTCRLSYFSLLSPFNETYRIKIRLE